jgi:cell division protein FtsB
MEELKENWQRSGVRVAILALVVVGIYFLVIFVQQSLNYYQLTKEVNKQEQRVEQLEKENQRLKDTLNRYKDEAWKPVLVKKNLPHLREPGEQVAIPVAQGDINRMEGPKEKAPEGPDPEELAALPAWRQWVRVIFTPAPVGP